MLILSRVVRRPSGLFTVTGPDGVQDEAETITCCHCGFTWAVRPGSGHVRGWCVKCNAPTCGAHACDTCLPYERRLEQAEQRYRLHIRMEGELSR